jgi:hypothetical protein
MVTSRQRMLTALTGERLPDRLPVTTHPAKAAA